MYIILMQINLGETENSIWQIEPNRYLFKSYEDAKKYQKQVDKQQFITRIFEIECREVGDMVGISCSGL